MMRGGAGVVLGLLVAAATPGSLPADAAAVASLERYRSAAPGVHRRQLVYPRASSEGASPPPLALVAGGVPLALFFPDEQLDPRAEVHLVSRPDLISLRVAERAAYIQLSPVARPGDEHLVTLTLVGGRPLPFMLRVEGGDGTSDATVEVRTEPEDAGTCEARLTRLREDLLECEESSGDRAVALIAGLLVEAPPAGQVVENRRLRRRDKQNRIYVEVLDSVRLYQHTFIRVRVENRDGSRRAWAVGEPSVTVVGPGPRRTPLKVIPVAEERTIEAGEGALLVLGFATPRLPVGAGLRLAIHEAGGDRHVVIEGLRP